MPAVPLEGLTKRYGRTTALDGVDLEVDEGSVLGLLGPNGAGRTTIVRVLATLLAPTVDVRRSSVTTWWPRRAPSES